MGSPFGFYGIDIGVETTTWTCCESRKVQESTYDFISVSSFFFARSCTLRRASISDGLYIFAFACLATSSYVNTANSTNIHCPNQHNGHQKRDRTRLTLLAPQGGTVHGPAHHPQNEPDRLVDTNVVFVFLFEKTLGSSVVRADGGRFPTGKIPRRIRMVELEAIVWVISSIEERDAKGPKT